MFECCREIFWNTIKRPLNPYKPTIATTLINLEKQRELIIIYIQKQKKKTNGDANGFRCTIEWCVNITGTNKNRIYSGEMV